MNCQEKIEAIKKDGLEKLHVICDFDRTMTTFEKGGSSYSPVRRLGFMPEEYGKKAMDLFYHYHPMEVDPLIPLDEKRAIMHEWWEAQFHLMASYGLKRQNLEALVGTNMVQLREGVLDFMNDLAERKIPMLILSAGFGDVIEIVLKEAGVYTDNVHVVANFMEYDEKGKAIAYDPPIIHGLNKCEQDLGPYKAEVEVRPNVFLVGDMLGDENMADGLAHDTVFKIGFNNKPSDENRAHYAAAFDHVIEDDWTWKEVNELWNQILSGGTL